MTRILRKLLLAVIACIAVASNAQKPQSAQPNAQQIDAKMQRKYRSLKSISYNLSGKITYKGPGGEVTGGLVTSSVRAVKPNRFIAEVTVEMLGKEFHTTLVTNGEKFWEYDPDGKLYLEKEWSAISKSPTQFAAWMSERSGGDVALPLALIFWNSAASQKDSPPIVKSVRLPDGTPAYEFRPTGVKFGTQQGDLVLSFDKASLLLRRTLIKAPIKLKQAKGVSITMTMEYHYSDIVLDEPAPDEVFAFRPPDDARLSPSLPSIGKRAAAVDNSPITEPEKKEPDPDKDKKDPPA